jgi:hypothetical protein
MARVSLTNRSGKAVVVTGVLRKSRSLAGGCTPAADFNYTSLPRLAEASSTSVVMETALFTGGSGCCTGGGGCDGRFTCTSEDSLFVVTNLGQVPAGSFTYQVNFRDCVACAPRLAGGESLCAAPR